MHKIIHNYVYHLNFVQALKSQYTDKLHTEGYFIGKPNLFTFKDPGNGLEPCLLINIKDDLEGCLMAAKPKNKQVSLNDNVHVGSCCSICIVPHQCIGIESKL